MPGDNKITQRNGSESQLKAKPFHFKYKNIVYDATGYLQKHPGGKIFFEYFMDQKDDITEYFRALHSKQALKILKQFPVVGSGEQSKDSKEYTEIKKKVKHLFKPNHAFEIFLMLLTFSTMLIGAFTQRWYVGVLAIWFTQTFSGWIAHSFLHSRDPLTYQFGLVYGPLVGGFSPKWWNTQHNLHHMFTNNLQKDTDIQHQYKRYLFQFLFLAWNYYGIMNQYMHQTIILLLLNWGILLNQSIWVVLLGKLIAGFCAANVLVGNHQKQTTFKEKVGLPFIEHQIVSTRNYYWTDFFSMIYMGGMQYQTEHHLFPQIPFYYLPRASKIIKIELAKINQKIHYGSVL